MNNKEILESKQGKKITMFSLGEMGFPQLVHCTLEKVEVKDWAQYTNILHIQYRPLRKRTSYLIRIKDHTDILFYDGYLNLKSDMFVEDSKMTLKCFDKKYFEIAKNSTDKKPFLEHIKFLK